MQFRKIQIEFDIDLKLRKKSKTEKWNTLKYFKEKFTLI